MADYIDRQAAIAALREFAEECKGSTEAATAAAMAISVISRLPGPWVSVEERHPDLLEDVLMAVRADDDHDDDYVTVGWYADNGERDWWTCVDDSESVSHWMPLPDAPEVGK